MARTGIGIALITLLTAAACGTAKPTPRHSRSIDVEDGDDLPRPPKPHIPRQRQIELAADGSFRGLFPGNPVHVSATGIRREAIAPDQRPHTPKPGEVTARDLQFEAAGIYTDPDQVRHLGLVPSLAWRANRDEDEPSMDVLWFDMTATGSPLPWSVWQSRSSSGSVIAYESKGEILAVRFIAHVQRLRPIAIDPRIPMALVESGSLDGEGFAQFDAIVGFHDSALVELLMLDVRNAAVSVAGNAIVTREVPMVSAACAPDQLVATGCATDTITYTWTGRTFEEGEPVKKLVKLVDVPPAKR